MSMQTPLRRILHFGAAHDGTGTFWIQRLTGAGMAILVIGFAVILAMTIGRPYEQVVAVLGSPIASAILALMVVAMVVHMRIGMQEIIEDYIQGAGLRLLCLAANTFFAFAIAAVGLLAIVKLALGA